MTEVALALWERAVTSLEGAERLVQIDPDGAASRSYYAAFHAVSALFILDNISFKKHKAVEAAVHRDLVLTGRWTKDLGADYSYLQRLRTTGPYGGQLRVSGSDAAEAVGAARRILDSVRTSRPDIFVI